MVRIEFLLPDHPSIARLVLRLSGLRGLKGGALRRHSQGSHGRFASLCTISLTSVRIVGNEATFYTTNIATPAANMATVVTATTIHPRRELGWPCISFLSAATIRIATRRKGASNPLMTAVQ